ncbi:dicarboxylate/amino acid:cation symporter [Methylohalobius crimeensis]|uniref:dicarboxylate/amino acid:cation symporter n=1 Tax=Methylohalobius crimeensis TaxID=244365 RepID=UPI00040B2E08|nr:dicarboxylate/amino acid:cation symporter [Methylohalobius crimeensis]
MGKGNHLTIAMLVAIVGAVVVGVGAPGMALHLEIGGEVFLRLLKMLVVPLVMSSVMSGIIGLGDVRKLRRPGAVAIAYYLTTTLLAVIVGVLLVNWIEPGGRIQGEALAGLAKDESIAATADASIATILENLVLMLFTDNLIGAMADTQLLPLIVFSILFAGILSVLGERVGRVTEFIVQLNEALMAFILMIMKIAPLGVFCLVAARFGEAQAQGAFLETLQQIGWYVLTVLLGLGVHAFVVLPVILWVFSRRRPGRFLGRMSPALLTAFSTASSSATLPVTMESAVDRAGVARESVEFVLPLGATINMDGTALYEAVAAIFIAQVLGIELSLLQQATVAITATLAAIGAAGIPEAGLVTMVIVLNAVGLPVEYIGILLSVDWLLDRFRTAVNVWGDSVGSAVVEKVMPFSVQPDSKNPS